MADRHSFFAQYNDPRWQRRRLQVMEAVDFQCENCGAKDTTLNVHHKRYRNDHKPWEYEDWELACYCEKCHKEWHDALEQLKDSIALNSTPAQLRSLSAIASLLEFAPFESFELTFMMREIAKSKMALNKDKRHLANASYGINHFCRLVKHWLKTAKASNK